MENLSIHPRHWKGGNGIIKDTSKPHKGRGKLAKKLQRLNKRQVDREATIRQPHCKAEAYKQPGSMNQHK